MTYPLALIIISGYIFIIFLNIMREKIFIIDAYGFIFRAYHIQPTLTTSIGLPVNALYGFTSMLIKFINDFKPTRLISVFDAGGKNFRHDIYSEYKSHRPPIDEDLRIQLPLTRNITDHLNIKSIEKAKFEADDLIATLSKKFSQDYDVVIISSDKDLMQLINDHTCMYDPIKSKYIREQEVIEKFGIKPTQVLDFLSIVGDKADNIPGIKSIGPKTAALLLSEYDTLENIIDNVDNITQKKRQQAIIDNIEVAKMSKTLVKLKDDIELDINPEDLKYTPPDYKKIDSFLKEYEFVSLSKRLSDTMNNHTTRVNNSVDIDYPKNTDIKNENSDNLLLKSRDTNSFQGVISDKMLNKVLDEINICGKVCIVSIKDRNFISQYVKSDLLSQSNTIQATICICFNNQTYLLLDNEVIIKFIEYLLARRSIKVITHNSKALLHSIYKLYEKYHTQPITSMLNNAILWEDVMLMYYVFTGGSASCELSEIINNTFNVYDVDVVTTLRYFDDLYKYLVIQLIKFSNYSVYKEVDSKLSFMLFEIEREGIKLEPQILKDISKTIDSELVVIEKKIFDITNEEFNIGSSKQLGTVLFEKLDLPFAKVSAKSKNYSTNVDVLEKLSEAGFIIADHILEWRGLSKLQSTYTDTLLNQIASDGRIHTEFSQVTTLTGRLSSLNPNLQNIPVRSKVGNQIRDAFVSKKDYSLISLDYSQIELRILASIANVEELVNAFASNQDIHTKTASAIFNIHETDITPEHRRKAKAINFGLIYGLSSYGLAKQLRINVMDAKSYITKYFTKYKGIQEYMERIKDFARKNGYVQNLFGRRCIIKGINDYNKTARSFAERSAINAPIQSTAADITKLAMLKIQDCLSKKLHSNDTASNSADYKSFDRSSDNKTNSNNTAWNNVKIILQVHDEIIIECPDDILDDVCILAKDAMESAVCIDVPLTTNVSVGKRWSLTKST